MTPNQKPSSAEIAEEAFALLREIKAHGCATDAKVCCGYGRQSHPEEPPECCGEPDYLGDKIDDLLEKVAALRSAAQPRGVPREPTEAMLDAFYTVGNGAGVSEAWVRKVWRAMFDAAPSDRDREDAERWRALCKMANAYGLAINPTLDRGDLRSTFYDASALSRHVDAAIAIARIK